MNAVLPVSLADESVDILEGDSGRFCAVIDDPTVQLDREVSVTLYTLQKTAASRSL